MNVKEYISSGVVESYVLGLISEADRKEFEVLCAQHPEIAEARSNFEIALERQLLSDAVPVPAHLRQRIEEQAFRSETTPLPLESKSLETPVRNLGPWKWLAAASLILLALSLFWTIRTQNKYKELQATNQNLQEQLARSSSELDTLRQEAQLLQKPGIKMATMQGTADSRLYATVYWDTASKDVYLLGNNLPATASDKQYQLWAILNGHPIDLGMIEVGQKRLLVRMKNVENAQAFAITLEPKGGSPAPSTTPIVLSRL